MIITLNQTTAAEVGQELLRARSTVGTSTGLVFTMVAIATECDAEGVLAACIDAGREHPSRILMVTTVAGEDRLDAEIRLGEDVPGDIIVLRLSGEVGEHADSVLLPLLLPDSPVIAWWPGWAPEDPGSDPIGRLADRRITDAMGTADPIASLQERAEHYAEGDTDLVWTRLTRWRTLLVAASEAYPWPITGAAISAAPGNAAAVLLAAWLEDRLGMAVQIHPDPAGTGISGACLITTEGELRLKRTEGGLAEFSAPGLGRRLVALPRRDLNTLITEELRRLDEDSAYRSAMARLASRRLTAMSATDQGSR